jgi:hypothetical protein
VHSHVSLSAILLGPLGDWDTSEPAGSRYVARMWRAVAGRRGARASNPTKVTTALITTAVTDFQPGNSRQTQAGNKGRQISKIENGKQTPTDGDIRAWTRATHTGAHGKIAERVDVLAECGGCSSRPHLATHLAAAVERGMSPPVTPASNAT